MTTPDPIRRPDDRDARPAPDLQDARRRRSRPSAASTSTSARARSSASSARTGPARPRRCGCSRRCSRRPAGEATVAGADLAPRAAAGPPAHRLRPAGRLDRPGRDRPRRARHPGPAVRHGQGRRPRRRAAEVLDGARPRRPPPTGRPAPTRAACAAGSTSGSASSTARASCSSTSRRPASTRRRAPACGTRSAHLRELGTTVFLTTHYLEEADALCRPPRDHRPRPDRGRGHGRRAQAAGRRRRRDDRRRRRRTSASSTLVRGQPFVREASVEDELVRLYVDQGDERRPAAHPAPRRRRACAPGRSTLARPSLDDVFLRQTGRSLREEPAA